VKKIIGVVVLLAFICSESFAASWKTSWRLQRGDTISGEFKVFQNLFIPLPAGEFVVIEKWAGESVNGIGTEGLGLAQLKNGTPVKYFEIARAYGLSKWTGHLDPIIEAETFKSKKEGCRERQHYSFLKFYKRGAAHNCLIVKHYDVQRELYGSDDDQDRVFSAGIRTWVKRNKIKLPDIYLVSEHWFMSMLVRDQWVLVQHLETPESFRNYKIKFTTRDTSEFHPDIIGGHPKAQKVLKDWKVISAKRHKDFEKAMKAKKQHLLDLSEFIGDGYASKQKSGDISGQLEKLNDLYKSGVLTKEEFEKAKKKILN
tara:strand:- start:380 stop:1321 length:942 start_codon:yes stop_codon:yes gene_type:complete